MKFPPNTLLASKTGTRDFKICITTFVFGSQSSNEYSLFRSTVFFQNKHQLTLHSDSNHRIVANGCVYMLVFVSKMQNIYYSLRTYPLRTFCNFPPRFLCTPTVDKHAKSFQNKLFTFRAQTLSIIFPRSSENAIRKNNNFSTNRKALFGVHCCDISGKALYGILLFAVEKNVSRILLKGIVPLCAQKRVKYLLHSLRIKIHRMRIYRRNNSPEFISQQLKMIAVKCFFSVKQKPA